MYYDVKYALYFLILLAPIICFHKKIMQQKKCSTWIIRNISWAANQNDFWRSCDTEDWSNDEENSAAHHEYVTFDNILI